MDGPEQGAISTHTLKSSLIVIACGSAWCAPDCVWLVIVESILDCECVCPISLGVPFGLKPFGLSQICQVILGAVRTAETIKSLPQPELESMADHATALMLAEAATQDDGSAMAVEEGDVTVSGSTGHIGKQLAVEPGEDGTPVAAAVGGRT